MAISEKEDERKLILQINKRVFAAITMCMVSTIWVLFSLLDCCIPATVTPEDWFARSGAVLVLGAALAEYQIILIHKMTAVSGYMEQDYFFKARANYSKPLRLLTCLTFFLVVIGTAIWGYGDLIYCQLLG